VTGRGAEPLAAELAVAAFLVRLGLAVSTRAEGPGGLAVLGRLGFPALVWFNRASTLSAVWPGTVVLVSIVPPASGITCGAGAHTIE
jgi:hypothetical protein